MLRTVLKCIMQLCMCVCVCVSLTVCDYRALTKGNCGWQQRQLGCNIDNIPFSFNAWCKCISYISHIISWLGYHGYMAKKALRKKCWKTSRKIFPFIYVNVCCRASCRFTQTILNHIESHWSIMKSHGAKERHGVGRRSNCKRKAEPWYHDRETQLLVARWT